MTKLEWVSDDVQVRLLADGQPAFQGSADHWGNAFLRLLNISDEDGRKFCESVATWSAEERGCPPSELSEVDFYAALQHGWSVAAGGQVEDPELLKRTQSWNGSLDTVWATRIAGNDDIAVVGQVSPAHGWLVDVDSGQTVREIPVEYEEEYFEGSVKGLGYGSYADQYDWRNEKADRQVRQCFALAEFLQKDLPQRPRILDIGSGYGYFLAAAARRGAVGDGIDVSRYAAAEAHERFGVETFVGTLEAFTPSEPYDLLTMWDCIEHVSNPREEFERTAKCASPGSLLFVRTPNILAVEREVFGGSYHSLKREHLHYFSPASLAATAAEAGWFARLVITESHLLAGFSAAMSAVASASQRGSDILAVFELVQ